jgi:hypothetical protein
VRKIRAENLRRCGARSAAQGERHVSGAAAKIEHASVGTLQNGVEFTRRAPPPQPIDVERENVIEQVVTRRNRSKHFPDGARGRFAVLGACGSGAYNSLFRAFHG